MTEGRFNRIREQHDAEVLDGSDHVRITNEQVAVTVTSPFVLSEDSQERGLINESLRLFYNISVKRDGDDFNVKIDFGTVGTRCKVPITGKYTGDMARSAAILECNNMMRDKLKKGYRLQYSK